MTQFIDRLTYDPEADAVDMRFVQTDGRLTTATMDERPIHLDFDEQGQLVAVEVLNASEYLPGELLERAETLDQNEVMSEYWIERLVDEFEWRDDEPGAKKVVMQAKQNDYESVDKLISHMKEANDNTCDSGWLKWKWKRNWDGTFGF